MTPEAIDAAATERVELELAYNQSLQAENNAKSVRMDAYIALENARHALHRIVQEFVRTKLNLATTESP